MALIFDKPTDREKEEWAKAEVLERAELSGQVYELSEAGRLYVLERDSPEPKNKIKVGYLTLVGVINSPSETLVSQVREASNWH